MTLYGLVDDRLRRDHARGLIDFYATRQAAERALRGVVLDEPTWEQFMRVAPFPRIGLPVVERSLN